MSLLESMRQKGEDLETLHHLASAALQSRATPATPHPLLSSTSLTTARDAEHLASHLITRTQLTAENLLRQLETSARPPPENPQSAFYTALRSLRESHRAGLPNRASNLLADLPILSFSGEEVSGKCLDLLQHHRNFVNIPGVSRVDYVTYIHQIDKFQTLSPSVRNSKPYERYLANLSDYLENFVRRAHPLEGDVLGDVQEQAKKAIMTQLSEIGAKYASTKELLDDLGMDGLKDTLLQLGLKCGGKGEERATRLLQSSRNGRFGNRAVLEKGVLQLLEALCEERAATVDNVERKLAQSFAEVQADRDGVVEESEDEEEVIYNPKDIPLGWDGKPMPYWMYKLHGLNHIFKCEICGGASYRGPRAFERHFSEGVHVAGLRRLGIGYSRAFMMVTGIQDALRLQKKIEQRREGDVEVEFEDEQGNVMNERTWKDLRRQGLI